MTTPRPTSKARARFLLKAAFEALDETCGSPFDIYKENLTTFIGQG